MTRAKLGECNTLMKKPCKKLQI